MSRYHLHARLYEGPLGAATRNELHTRGTDDLAEVEKWAKEWASGGFTVWIYDHSNTAVAPGGSNYQTILTFTPDGQSVDPR